MLGAVLGVVVANLFYEQTELAANHISPNAVAFLTGLGVKAVYGALENMVDTVHKSVSRKPEAAREKLPTRVETTGTQSLVNDPKGSGKKSNGKAEAKHAKQNGLVPPANA